MQRFRVGLLVAVLIAVCAPCAVAKPGKKRGPIPPELLFQDYDTNRMEISPDGRSLASLTPREDKKTNEYWNVLAVARLGENQPRILINDKDIFVVSFWWVGDERLLIRYYSKKLWYPATMSRSLSSRFGLMACNADGSDMVTLQAPGIFNVGSPRVGLMDADVVHSLPDNPDEVLVARVLKGAIYEKPLSRHYYQREAKPGVYRLNTRTGDFKLEVADPELTLDWVADRKGRVRLAFGLDRTAFTEDLRPKNELALPETRLYWINDDGSAELIPDIATGFEDGFYVSSFDSTGTKFEFISRQGGDLAALWTYHRTTKSVEGPKLKNDRVDLLTVGFGPVDPKSVRVLIPDGRDKVWYTDDRLASMQPGLDEALPEFVNVFSSWDRKLNRVLIFSYSGAEPGRYYLFDRQQSSLESVFHRAPWTTEWELSDSTPVSFLARDGVRIDGYLTLPPGAAPGTRHPMFLLVHGGPWLVRDGYSFNPEVQFLASRGYAVLRVNFRGSGGYGVQFDKLGHGEFGRKMQDDLTDGVRWAVEKGIADPDRLGIAGGSYGGYAVLRALTREPDLFKVGLSYFAPVDIGRQIQFYKTNEHRFAHRYWIERIGDPDKDRELLAEISPVNHLGRIKAPLFIVYGEDDPVVDYQQSAALTRGLRAAKKKFVRFAPRDERHGIQDERSRIKIFTELDKFLKEHFSAGR